MSLKSYWIMMVFAVSFFVMVEIMILNAFDIKLYLTVNNI